jgi:hypothetical protein
MLTISSSARSDYGMIALPGGSFKMGIDDEFGFRMKAAVSCGMRAIATAIAWRRGRTTRRIVPPATLDFVVFGVPRRIFDEFRHSPSPAEKRCRDLRRCRSRFTMCSLSVSRSNESTTRRYGRRDVY